MKGANARTASTFDWTVDGMLGVMAVMLDDVAYASSKAKRRACLGASRPELPSRCFEEIEGIEPIEPMLPALSRPLATFSLRNFCASF
jgi:hypothetical protein